MTEQGEGSALVPLVDEEANFVERHPFLALAGATLGGYILGRFAGDEILNATMRTISGYVGKQVEGVLTEITRK